MSDHSLLSRCTLGLALLVPFAVAAEVCTGFGPQSPRDIAVTTGENPLIFGAAPAPAEMHLCNIHLHENAEHRAPEYAILKTTSRDDGVGAGYQCEIATTLTKAELKAPKVNHCTDLQPGDTVEVHWVFSSCPATPGKGLGSCLTENCVNPTLRVEAQVYTLVNDPNALDFMEVAYQGHAVNGKPQPKALPVGTGAPVQYLGSTTGPSYDEATCSPLQVHWSVRPQCAKLDINSLSAWCKDNVFEEKAPHGVRELVTDASLLSEMR
ncbi:hypothetical protein KHP57_07410 [Algiphilus sp. NNCM1]|uniref:delta-class carbonic anhydrase n=1 Tax=Algiphilus sp. TaxID=1872431 RepID=UPI001CA678D4|nr:delta-class carbonic anhydrase [Algiphilus sp.]MBY8965530.1 hypothetical protein [Algiphilus acroporae]MCI5063481.1 delta-class carbonic anhydrase [Algiphilus sp.]MCI5102987.1 delta-class carbonic anhydrase [Algiphilus sp.]